MNLNKIRIVAATEFTQLVKTKAFIVSIILMPLASVGFSFVSTFLITKVDTQPRHFAVLDSSGLLYKVLEEKAKDNNSASDDPAKKIGGGIFVPVRANLQGHSLQEVRRELANQVRQEKLFAFIEIPEGLAKGDPDESLKILYYSDTPSYYRLRAWISGTLNDEIRNRRYRALGLDSRVQARLEKDVSVENKALSSPEEGKSNPKEKEKSEKDEVIDSVKGTVAPLVPMFILFFVVLLAAPQMMTAVMEERATRISEVLLGSVGPFELMMGKLLASTMASLLVGAIYIGGALSLAGRFGYSHLITPSQLGFFFLFVVLGAFLHGSMYLSVGAIFNNPKEAQGLMTPLMLITMMPMILMGAMINDPTGAVAMWLSFFPPTAPFIMCFRLAVHPTPPFWQVLLSIMLTFGTTLFTVWVAGRIFRVGLLAQGKAPSIGQLARWVFGK